MMYYTTCVPALARVLSQSLFYHHLSGRPPMEEQAQSFLHRFSHSFHLSVFFSTQPSIPPSRLTNFPILYTFSPSASSSLRTSPEAIADTTNTIPTPLLNVRLISSTFTLPACCNHSNTFGLDQLDTSISAER